MNNLTENINLFQPTGFKVILDRKHYNNLAFFVQRINHPGAQNAAAETPFSRIGSVPMPGNTMTYSELSMDVLLDEDFEAYQEMYNWMLRLVNEEQVSPRDAYSRYSVEDDRQGGKIPTYADIHITALTNSNNKNKSFKYIDCVPVSIGDIAFEATNAGVDFLTFPVSFRFSYFTIE